MHIDTKIPGYKHTDIFMCKYNAIDIDAELLTDTAAANNS